MGGYYIACACRPSVCALFALWRSFVCCVVSYTTFHNRLFRGAKCIAIATIPIYQRPKVVLRCNNLCTTFSYKSFNVVL